MTTASPRPPAPPKPATTVGHDLHHSPAVRQAIDAIVAQVKAASARITGPRGPLPGLTESYDALMARAAESRGRALMYPYLGSGVGRGALVELADGSVKWDMLCGIGVHFFGHSDPDLAAAALAAGLDNTVKQGNLISNNEAYTFLDTLLAEARKSSRLRHAYLATSGCMANENALKVCFQKTGGAPRVLAFRDCFMGRSVVMSQIGDTAAYRQGVPLSVLVDYMPFWDPAAAAAMGKARFIDAAVARLREYIERYPKQHACFIFELVQGEGGFNVGDRDFFKALMDVCRAHAIPIWDDEIQTFGRTTAMFAYDLFDLGEYVDVFCVGKMTQACATLWTPEFNPQPGLLSGTFIGEGVSFRVGQRVLERLRDGDFYGPTGRFSRHHAAFAEQVNALIARRPAWFPNVPALTELHGGIGGMMRFTPFGGDKDKVQKAARACFDEGVILFYAGHGPYHLRMLPPLPVFDEKDWPAVFQCVERGLARVAGE
ncbi:MAG: aminotransferase class III-fold pyridoxal phosphate-dependent enzyme [Phycisphaerae bacterium]|nr:aminotransferase class III-fold pyridoxal phosphate-dependent enzyme [Phycisphaerae bacterium]